MRHKFDLNLLTIAVALHDQRSVTGAARKLGMSQPALSAALGRLRAGLGDALFLRTSGGMIPTPRGQEIVLVARDVLSRIDERVLQRAPFDPTDAELKVTIAVSDVGEMVFLPRILRHLKQISPSCLVRSTTPSPADLENGLETGDIDLAIGYFPDLRGQNFVQQRLFDHYFLCLLRADHAIRDERLSLKQFVDLEHAVVRASGRSQEIVERYLRKRKIVRKVALLTPHFMSLPMIIAQSDLIATVPHAAAMYYSKAVNNVRSVMLPFDSPKIELKQHWHRKFQNDPKSRWIRSIVRDLFSTETDEWRDPRLERRQKR